MLELDHVIVFCSGPDELDGRLAPALAGFTRDSGTRHHGQGTRNVRVAFTRHFIELLWIDDPAPEATSGLGFAPRCAGAPGACRYGVVLRGRVASADRPRFVEYEVPGAAGMTLLLLDDTRVRPELPFVAVWETPPDRLESRHPARRAGAATLHHPNGATAIAHTELVGQVPELAEVADVSFVAGPPALRLTFAGLSGDRRF